MSALPDTRPPLVVDLGRGFYAWIQNALGFTINADSHVPHWQPLVDAEGLGGTVLNSEQIQKLVERVGKPTP